MSEKKEVSKKVKVTPLGEHFVEETKAYLWGFNFELVNDVFVCEMSEEDAKANIDAGRVKAL